MRFSKTLVIIPALALLAACGQTRLPMSKDDPLLSEQQTEAPHDFVVYPDDKPSVPDGKLVWDKSNCASCHGADGAGGKDVPALNDFLAMSEKKPVELYKRLTYGKGGADKNDPHRLQQTLSNREIWNLAFYARSLAVHPLTSAEISEIDPVFGSNCAVCHGTKGDGDGPLARNLEPWPANFQTFRRFYDRTDNVLYDHIANGIKWEGMPNFLGKEDRKKGVKFDQPYIRKLVQYVRNFHMSNDPTTPGAVASAAATTTNAASKTSSDAEAEKSSEKTLQSDESKKETSSEPKPASDAEGQKTNEAESKSGEESH